jgi:hypothetical protein
MAVPCGMSANAPEWNNIVIQHKKVPWAVHVNCNMHNSTGIHTFSTYCFACWLLKAGNAGEVHQPRINAADQQCLNTFVTLGIRNPTPLLQILCSSAIAPM